MPRYEFKDAKSSKFWDISISGSEVTTNWGRIGTDGQSKTKSLDDGAAAQKEYDKQIAAKTKKGYELAAGSDGAAAPAAPTKTASNPDLEAAIDANRDDSAAYQVYGDWLQSQGDPLGELVSLQCAMAAEGTADSDLRAAEAKLMRAHTEHFFGPAHEDADKPGLSLEDAPQWGQLENWPKHWQYGFARTQWRFGFVDKLWYDTGYYDDKDERGSDVAAAPLRKMLSAPSARFIREIMLGELWASYEMGEGPDMSEAINAIGAAPCAENLLKLSFAGGDHDLSGVELDATGLAEACPNLESLDLYAGQLTVGKLDFPKMKTFAAQTGGLAPEDMKSICNHKMPLIEDLEVWFGDEEYGGDCSIGDVEPLLKKEMPHLKRLGLMNATFGDDICRAVLASPLLPQLKKLDLSMGVITDAGANALIEAKDKLAHLEHISIRGYFSDDVAAALNGLAVDRSIEVEGDMSEDHRYVEVSE